jgi:c(7)-type cytochrome triheme protein
MGRGASGAWGVGVALAAALAALGGAAAARGPNTVAPGARVFDHDGHAAAEKAKTGAATGCDGACHQGPFGGGGERQLGGSRAAKAAEHGRCFGRCHAAEHTTRRCEELPAVSAECVVCHNPKDACLKPGLAAAHAALGPSFVTSYSHPKHTIPGASGRQCGPCHGEIGDRRDPDLSVGHPFCGGCHGTSFEPPMTACDGCHRGLAAAPKRTPRAPSPYATTGAFDHRGHASAARVGADGKTCLACHANIATADPAVALPMPTMQGCYESCHDGDKAFSATGTSCTRCHRGGSR